MAAAFTAALATAQIPRPAPDIQFAPVTGGGGRVRLSDFRGKVVVIEFLLTTCPGCKHSGAILARLQREYGPRGLQVIGLAVDAGSAARIPVFAAETGALFPIAAYSDAAARDFLQAPIMLRMSYPQIVIIDRKGMLREHFRGEDPRMGPQSEEATLRRAIERLLAENGDTKKGPQQGKKQDDIRQ